MHGEELKKASRSKKPRGGVLTVISNTCCTKKADCLLDKKTSNQPKKAMLISYCVVHGILGLFENFKGRSLTMKARLVS